MSRKAESQFIIGVHKHMPPCGRGMYRMKNNNEYTGGIADCWYSGDGADLWIEYKHIVVPKLAATMIKPDCSPLQVEWLADRHSEGRNVHVIVGCADGGVVYHDRSWERAMSTQAFRQQLKSRKDLAAEILAFIS